MTDVSFFPIKLTELLIVIIIIHDVEKCRKT